MPTVHYFWVGAVPAMLFLGVVMMPFYYGSKVRSVPEFMFRRFGTGAHLVNAISFAVAQLLIAGVNLALLAGIVHALLGWPIWIALDRGRRDRALLHHARRPERGDLQRGAAVLRHRGLAAAADADRPPPRRRLGRPHRQDHRSGRERARRRRRRARRPAARVVARQGPGGLRLLALLGDRHRLRPRLRAVLRLLDDELRRGAARDGVRLDLRGPQDADHRRLPQDVHPVHRDHPRHGLGGPRDRDDRPQERRLARRAGPRATGSPTTTRCCC